ncbi:MAG: toxin-antitoxin system YwqK family antitoxin, partial [candidate division Zixibacteria bacterium]|nr:toxin-antitoxin system YwqK family antitoxin [candidate division Zixibacteria bacterium]
MNKTFLLSTILVFTLLTLHCALFKNLGKEFYETGELHYEYKFVGRRRNGVAKEYYKTGELKGEWVYKNGMLLDTGKGYYRTGELQYKYKYENGKLNGVTKQYYRTGELKSEWIYEDGMLLDTGKGYYRTGELRFKHKYENGKLNGITKEYYRTGELWAEWEYKNGKHVSGCKEYYKNGELKPKQRTVKEINKGLLDTTKIDTTIWHTEYNKFLSKLDLTLRSREKIDSIITCNEQYILNTLNKYDLKIKEIDTLSFFFYRNGKLWIPVLSYTKDSDTTIGNAVNRAIAEITLDSIPSEEYIASGQLL